MSEQQVVADTSMPVTVAGLIRDMRALGVREGDCLLVHASLSSLGWVCGGPQAVIEALLQAVGATGTIVMPAQSGDWSDPAEWADPPVPQSWFEVIYREMPAFDPLVTPTRGMGRIAESFRGYPGTIRSSHPQVSFCANGTHAAAIVANHVLTPQFGKDTPLGKLYALAGSKVLLLGSGFDSCTAWHLAETMLPGMPRKRMGTALSENGERIWKRFEDYAYDAEDFEQIGRQLVERGELPPVGKVGNAACRLFGLRESVDAAKSWLGENRRPAAE